jgi:hypothetical protein
MNLHLKNFRTANARTVAKKISIIALAFGLFGALGAARAEGPDTDYLAIYSVMDQADALNQKGKTTAARAKYIEAQRALAEFQKNNPGWNNQMVGYRQNRSRFRHGNGVRKKFRRRQVAG